jgi:hypothetical protein
MTTETPPAADDPRGALRREVFDLEPVIGRVYGMAQAGEALADFLVRESTPDVDYIETGLVATTTAVSDGLKEIEKRFYRIFDLVQVIAPSPGQLPD